MAGQDEPVFSLTPATANEGFLNYALKRDKETYNTAVKKLSEDEFDCSLISSQDSVIHVYKG
jgi:hypothetical protein